MANQVEGRFKIHFPYHMLLESVGGPEKESSCCATDITSWGEICLQCRLRIGGLPTILLIILGGEGT